MPPNPPRESVDVEMVVLPEEEDPQELPELLVLPPQRDPLEVDQVPLPQSSWVR